MRSLWACETSIASCSCEEACAQPGAVRTRRKHGREAASCGDAAGGDDRHRVLIQHAFEQRQQPRGAGVPAGFSALHRQHVRSGFDCLAGALQRLHLADGPGAGGLALLDVGARVGEGEGDHRHAHLQRCFQTVDVILEAVGDEADAEGSVCQGLRDAYLLPHPIDAAGAGRAEQPETARRADRARQRAARMPGHGRREDRLLDAEEVRNASPEHISLLADRPRRRGDYAGKQA